ncbi:MAG TPA: hypothetical protein VML95_12240 [Longimicrobiales bacterium]|nr:hypothetical protein [Longimicrobiales bacterium]
MPVHAKIRLPSGLLAAGAVLVFAACADSGEQEPVGPQFVKPNQGVDCSADPALLGTSPLTVNVVDGGTGGPLTTGFVAVFVHPVCGPIRFGADTDLDGKVIFADLQAVSGFVHVRDGVTLAASELDFSPPPLGESELDLSQVPGHAATMTGKRGASLPVTLANYQQALGDPPVNIKNNGSNVTIVMPQQQAIQVNLFNLDIPLTDLPVAALLRFGAAGACAGIPWIAADPDQLALCESGGGIAYQTGLDKETDGASAFVMGDPDDPDCVIEVIGRGDVSQELIAASAPCSDADEDNVLRLFPRPALCVLPPMTGAGFIEDVRGTAKAIDYQNATFGATALNYPGVPGDQVPDLTKVAIFGDFLLLQSPANGKFQSKQTTTNGANSENLSFTAIRQGDGDVVCGFPDAPANAVIFCVSDDGVHVQYAVIQRSLDPNRIKFEFMLSELGGDAIPDPDQAGGESFQTVPAPPAACTYESDGTRFSVKF